MAHGGRIMLMALVSAAPLLGGIPASGAEGTTEGTGGTATVVTVAGTSPAGYSGDGGPATEAQMHEPRMMTFDSAGNMFIVDTFNHLIRKVDTAGTMSTVAGKFSGFVPREEADCEENFSGDGGPATEADLSCPHGVAVDGADVYIADSANHAIRKVDATGTITTVVGQGGQSGDSGDGGPGTAARIQGPKGIVLDGQGGLLIADSGNDRIKRLDLATGVVTAVAGTGEQGGKGDGGPATLAEMVEPRTIAVGPDGSIFVAEPKAHRVRRIDPNGIISTYAGTGRSGFSGDGGPATEAELDLPRGVGADAAGNVYIADSLNQRIRRVDPSGVITTVAGRGEACYFSSSNNCGDGGPPLEAGFATPRAVEAGPGGDLWVTDTFNERVRRITFP